MSRPMWLVSIVKAGLPYSKYGAMFTKVPLLGRVAEHIFFKDDEIIILPQDRVVTVGEEVDGEASVVVPSKVVEHFIERAEHLFIMDKCICRDSMDCDDYPHDIGCLFMGEAALGINRKLGHVATREEAMAHVARSREAGLFHLIGRNRLDTVWLGVGPGEKLLTVCNCCTCCCIWRMLPHVADSVSANVSRMPGVTVAVTGDCTGCATCEEVCFTGAARVTGGVATIGAACRGCGRCAEVCPESAITVHIDGVDSIDLSIESIAPTVDIS